MENSFTIKISKDNKKLFFKNGKRIAKSKVPQSQIDFLLKSLIDKNQKANAKAKTLHGTISTLKKFTKQELKTQKNYKKSTESESSKNEKKKFIKAKNQKAKKKETIFNIEPLVRSEKKITEEHISQLTPPPSFFKGTPPKITQRENLKGTKSKLSSRGEILYDIENIQFSPIPPAKLTPPSKIKLNSANKKHYDKTESNYYFSGLLEKKTDLLEKKEKEKYSPPPIALLTPPKAILTPPIITNEKRKNQYQVYVFVNTKTNMTLIIKAKNDKECICRISNEHVYEKFDELFEFFFNFQNGAFYWNNPLNFSKRKNEIIKLCNEKDFSFSGWFPMLDTNLCPIWLLLKFDENLINSL